MPLALVPLIATAVGVPIALAAQARVPADAQLQQADRFGRIIDAAAAGARDSWIIGHNLLSKHRVTFDLPRGVPGLD